MPTLPPVATPSRLPPLRSRALPTAGCVRGARHVIYWLTSARRRQHNFALQRAVEWASALRLPLLIVDHLPSGGPFHTARSHTFAAQAMAELAAYAWPVGTAYLPCIDTVGGEVVTWLRHIAAQAAVVVTDEPATAVEIAALEQLATDWPTAVEAVDGHGLLPRRAVETVFLTAASFRRALQRLLPEHLTRNGFPLADPLADWSATGLALGRGPGCPVRCPDSMLRATPILPDDLPIDRTVGPVADHGGDKAARGCWRTFLTERLNHYADGHSHPDDNAASGLSPYLHGGQISAHQIFAELMFDHHHWDLDALAKKPNGRRTGWWGVETNTEAFLDELITWRELGHNFAWQRVDVDQYNALPTWARDTLKKHAADPRPTGYSLTQFAEAATHDPVWNAAQRELLRTGRIHNYLRMLWGKKILEWSGSPEEAFATMLELNNKYALDGCDPSSSSGIAWVLGRYDRPWGPERPIFGTIRYMSSDATKRKIHLKKYLEKFGP